VNQNTISSGTAMSTACDLGKNRPNRKELKSLRFIEGPKESKGNKLDVKLKFFIVI
jgi:hypothetical protein